MHSFSRHWNHFDLNRVYLQSWTKLLENGFSLMRTNLPKRTIFKSMALRKEYPFPQFKVASYKRRPRDQAVFWRHDNTVSSHPCFAAWFAVTRINGGVALSFSWAPRTRLLVNILYWSILIFTLPYQNLPWLFTAIWVLFHQSAECSSEYFKVHWIRHAFEQLDKQCADDNTAFTNALNNFATYSSSIYTYIFCRVSWWFDL